MIVILISMYYQSSDPKHLSKFWEKERSIIKFQGHENNTKNISNNTCGY